MEGTWIEQVPLGSILPTTESAAADDDDEEELVWKLCAHQTFSDFLNAVPLEDILNSWRQYECIFITNDCCFGDFDLYTDRYNLNILLRVDDDDDDKIRKLSLSARDADSSTSTLNTLLESIFLGNNRYRDITIKAFATNPRVSLPMITFLNNTTPATTPSSKTTLRFHFLNLTTNYEFCKQLFHSTHFQEIEFIQCTANDTLSQIFKEQQQEDEKEQGKEAVPIDKKLTISCTMDEFHRLTCIGTTIVELNLLLHFYLQGAPMEQFCKQTLQPTATTTSRLQTLTIQYLDISDEYWTLLFQSLSNSLYTTTLQNIQLSFTDNFVDTYRRLNEQRRQKRTQDVLDLLQTLQQQPCCLAEIKFPIFQQDEAIMKQVEELLEINRHRV